MLSSAQQQHCSLNLILRYPTIRHRLLMWLLKFYHILTLGVEKNNPLVSKFCVFFDIINKVDSMLSNKINKL